MRTNYLAKIFRLSCSHLPTLILALGLGSGCASKDLKNLRKVRQDEAMAVAKFRILYNGKDATKGSTVVFNCPKFGVPMYQYPLDESGYVFAKLRVGTNSIDMLLHKFSQHGFGSGELTCNVAGGGTVNYLGDITIEWKSVGSGTGLAIMAVAGSIGSALATQGNILVGVESHEAEAQQAFAKKFGTTLTVTPALLVVKPKEPVVTTSGSAEKKDKGGS